MKIAFKVDRIGFYRLFAPLVDEALRRGAQVLLLHRDLPTDREGPKAYQWADPAAVPAFRHGTPRVAQYEGHASLYEICRADGVDALVTIWAWSDVGACERLRDEGVAWIALQESHEFHVFPVEVLLRPDATCMFSEWWIELAERYYADAPRGMVRERLVATGWPELDSFALVERGEVRRRLRIPVDAPVVTLATYKQHLDDPWEQIVFRSSTRATALARALVSRRLDLLPAAGSGLTYATLLRAVRAFCDRNGAFFISKARGKDRAPRVERRLADAALLDEGYYPATIVELASISDVFISFLSTATLEAVYGGAYSICPMPPEESAWLRAPASARFRDLLAYREAVSLWNFPGIVDQRPMRRLVEELPAQRVAELRPDPRARTEYVTRFLGGAEPRHASRTFEAIAGVVERKRARGRASAASPQ